MDCNTRSVLTAVTAEIFKDLVLSFVTIDLQPVIVTTQFHQAGSVTNAQSEIKSGTRLQFSGANLVLMVSLETNQTPQF